MYLFFSFSEAILQKCLGFEDLGEADQLASPSTKLIKRKIKIGISESSPMSESHEHYDGPSPADHLLTFKVTHNTSIQFGE